MSRRRGDDDEVLEPEEDEEAILDEEEEEEEVDEGKSGRKRRRCEFIDDVAEEDEDEDEEDDDFLDGGGRLGGHRHNRRVRSRYIDDIAMVDSDGEDDEDDGEDDFIVDHVTDLQDDDDGRSMHRRPLLPREDDLEDVEALERSIQARYARSSHTEYDEETAAVEQQAFLPSVRDPKLWMVKCVTGCEREAAVCLMQKYLDKGSELQIRSAIALDHLKNYIYVEAAKEAHVKEACKGMRVFHGHAKITLVPIKEMTDVLSVESKAIDLSRDTWVRMKRGKYKGDLARVVDVDNVQQRVKVKLIPRIDLQAIANKLEGREVPKKNAFVPPARFLNVDEARGMRIRVEHRRDPMTGDYFEKIDGMMFKDGFLYKIVSMKSISTQNIKPTFDELEKFRQPGENGDGDGDMASLSTVLANRKKGHFMKGDQVIFVRGDLKDLKGWVEKVDEEYVHIRPNAEGLPKTLTVNEKELCKYFKPGNHVKVVSGASEGATGMVIEVEGHVVMIVSDTTREPIQLFADNVAESSGVTSGVTRIGDYELHDLVMLDNRSFGVIIRVESEALRVLKGVERPEVALVKPREIKCKVDGRTNALDQNKNPVSVKDVVRILAGPCKGNQGPVQHIFRGILFIYDCHHREHAGFICAKSQSCIVLGGSCGNANINGDTLASTFSHLRTPTRVPQSPGRLPSGAPMDSGARHRGGRGHDRLVGTTVKVCRGPYKGSRGRVVDFNGSSVRVELESQMKIVAVDHHHISDNLVISTHSVPRCGTSSETPMHRSRTPLHPSMTPMKDPGAIPIHNGMRTPMRDRAWNPHTPMSPPRSFGEWDSWVDANPGSWGTSPLYQPGSPPSTTYQAPTPGSDWTNTPGCNYVKAGTPRDNSHAYGNSNAPSPYLPSTPGGQLMTPISASYLPGTPGGQPMTPGSGGLDVMSPALGGGNEGLWALPDILVNVSRSGEDTVIGVVREVLSDGSCRINLGSNGNGNTVIAHPTEIDLVVPRKSDKVKIMSGSQRGSTGKLIGIDGSDGIVKEDATLEVTILEMNILAKVAQSL